MDASEPQEKFVVAASDLAPASRITHVAMRLFALKGFAATTVRDIAHEAGVSVGLIQHHFHAKAGVRRAVDNHVARVFSEAFDALPQLSTQHANFRDLGNRITEVVRDHPQVVAYVVRSATDGDQTGTDLVDEIVRVALGQIDGLADRGLVREDVDREWAALSIVVMSMSTLLFRTSVERLLGTDFFDSASLERWNTASIDLFERGVGS